MAGLKSFDRLKAGMDRRQELYTTGRELICRALKTTADANVRCWLSICISDLPEAGDRHGWAREYIGSRLDQANRIAADPERLREWPAMAEMMPVFQEAAEIFGQAGRAWATCLALEARRLGFECACKILRTEFARASDPAVRDWLENAVGDIPDSDEEWAWMRQYLNDTLELLPTLASEPVRAILEPIFTSAAQPLNAAAKVWAKHLEASTVVRPLFSNK